MAKIKVKPVIKSRLRRIPNEKEYPAVIKDRIRNHLEVAKHLALASKYYYHAAAFRKEGNFHEADKKVSNAIRHVAAANNCLIKDMRFIHSDY